jgi:hypothetical protein
MAIQRKLIRRNSCRVHAQHRLRVVLRPDLELDDGQGDLLLQQLGVRDAANIRRLSSTLSDSSNLRPSLKLF